MNVPGYHNDKASGSFISSDQSGSETPGAETSNFLPSTDLGIHPAYNLLPQLFPRGTRTIIGTVSNIDAHRSKKTMRLITVRSEDGRSITVAQNTDQNRFGWPMNGNKQLKTGMQVKITLFGDLKNPLDPPKVIGIKY